MRNKLQIPKTRPEDLVGRKVRLLYRIRLNQLTAFLITFAISEGVAPLRTA